MAPDDHRTAEPDSASAQHPGHQLSNGKRVAFIAVLFAFGLIAAEIGARAVDACTSISLDEHRERYAYRRHCRLGNHWPAQRGDYPYLPYVPNADDPRVNSLGFRGDEIERDKPDGVYRIICMGGSTTWDEYPARLQEQLADDFESAQMRLEVINAGDVAWTSMETQINFLARCLPLRPDAIVIYHGINDAIPAFGDTYSFDYSHWRGRLERNTPVIWDKLPRLLDHSAAYVGIRAMFERKLPALGWNEMTTRYDVDFEHDKFNGMETYRQNIFNIITIARARGIETYLCTPVFNYEYKFKYSLDRWGMAVEEANQVTRSFGSRWPDVHVIDVAEALRGGNDWMIDFCHFTPEGKTRLATFIADHIRPGIDRLVSRHRDCLDVAALIPDRPVQLANYTTDYGAMNRRQPTGRGN